MWCELSWDGSPTPGTVGQDIVDVLTGETSLGNLSGDIDSGNSSITSTINAGWSVYDSSTGTSDEWVLRAACDGDATQYKYVKLRFYTSGSDRVVGWQLMEDWNSSTNTPTNACTEDTQQLFRVPVESNGDTIQALFLSASARYMMFRVSGFWGGGWFPCLEIDRWHPCFAVGNGFVPAVQIDDDGLHTSTFTTYGGRVPKVVDDAGTSNLTNQPVRVLASQGYAHATSSTSYNDINLGVAYDTSSNASYGIDAIVIERRELVGSLLGTSDVSDVWMMQAGSDTAFNTDLSTHTLDSANDTLCVFETFNNATTAPHTRLIVKNG